VSNGGVSAGPGVIGQKRRVQIPKYLGYVVGPPDHKLYMQRGRIYSFTLFNPFDISLNSMV